MMKHIIAPLAIITISALGVWSVNGSSSHSSTPTKLHSHIEHKPQQKMNSNLQIKIERLPQKGGGTLLQGKIQARRPVAEVVHYKWVLPEGLPSHGLNLEGQLSGLRPSGELIELDLTNLEVTEGQSIILTAHFYRNRKKLGNSTSHKLTPPSLLPQNLNKSSSTKKSHTPKLIF